MRIAIITFHRAYNCGALLQAWALKTVLERLGHSVEFPICNHVGSFRSFHFLRHMSLSGKSPAQKFVSIFGRAYLDALALLGLMSPKRQYDRLRRKLLRERRCKPGSFARFYDCCVIGSDQVWNPVIAEEYAGICMGAAIPDGLPLVAYAASCGDTPLDEEYLKRLGGVLGRHVRVSAREPYTREQVSRYYSGRVDVVADPTLLLRMEDYAAIRAPIKRARPYIYVYALWATEFIVRTAEEIARRKGLDLVVTPVYSHINDGVADRFEMNVTPDRMVGYIAGAEYVIAASFHGTALSLVHGKKFLSLRDKRDAHESRPSALLRQVGMSDRLAFPDMTVDEMIVCLDREYPPEAEKRLEKFRQESLRWLEEALGSIEGERK